MKGREMHDFKFNMCLLLQPKAELLQNFENHLCWQKGLHKLVQHSVLKLRTHSVKRDCLKVMHHQTHQVLKYRPQKESPPIARPASINQTIKFASEKKHNQSHVQISSVVNLSIEHLRYFKRNVLFLAIIFQALSNFFVLLMILHFSHLQVYRKWDLFFCFF